MGDGSGGAVFSREEAAEVFRKIDRDGSGDITMLELIKVLNPKLMRRLRILLALLVKVT